MKESSLGKTMSILVDCSDMTRTLDEQVKEDVCINLIATGVTLGICKYAGIPFRANDAVNCSMISGFMGGMGYRNIKGSLYGAITGLIFGNLIKGTNPVHNVLLSSTIATYVGSSNGYITDCENKRFRPNPSK